MTPNYTNSPDIRILSLTWERLTDRGVERKKDEERQKDEEKEDHRPDPSMDGVSPPAGNRGRR